MASLPSPASTGFIANDSQPTVLRFLLAKDKHLSVFIAFEMKVLPSLASTSVRAAYSLRE